MKKRRISGFHLYPSVSSCDIDEKLTETLHVVRELLPPKRSPLGIRKIVRTRKNVRFEKASWLSPYVFPIYNLWVPKLKKIHCIVQDLHVKVKIGHTRFQLILLNMCLYYYVHEHYFISYHSRK